MSNLSDQTEVSCNDGNYVINERLVRRIIESYYRARANIDFSRREDLDTAWYEPGISVLSVDWEKARSYTQLQTNSKLYSTWMVSMPTMQPRIAELRRMQRDTAILIGEFRRKSRELQRQSAEARQKMDSFWGAATTTATVARDISATALMVGSTVLTGGTAAALLSAGAGTGLRFTGKLQDSPGKWQKNIGAATAQAVGDLIFTVVPVTRAGAAMRNAQGTQKAVIMFVEAKWDVGVSLLEGKEVSEALLDGSMSLLFSSAGNTTAVGKAKDAIAGKLTGWALPVMIRSTGTKSEGMRAAKFMARTATGLAGGKVKQGATYAANAARNYSQSSGGQISSSITHKNVHRNGLDHAAIVDPCLVDRAVRRVT